MLQNVIDNTHAQFVKAVAEGRKLPLAQVSAIADGRILTGEQALAAKLIDRLGTMQDAIEEAGRLGGIKGEPEVITAAEKEEAFYGHADRKHRRGDRCGMARQGNEFSVNYELEGMGR